MSGNPASGSSVRWGQRIFLTLFFSVFFLLGLAFTIPVARSTLQNLATLRWATVDGTVVESRTVPASSGSGSASFEVNYRYRYKGNEYTSSQYTRGMSSTKDTAGIYRLAGQLTRGASTRVYVNPDHPEEAVLQRGSLWYSLIVLFPLIFVGVGAGGIYFAWQSSRVRPVTSQASSVPRRSKLGRMGGAMFFGVFLLIGVGMVFPFFIQPVRQIQAAKRWPEVPCEIVSSRVQSHSGSKSTTYSIEMVYRYAVNGQSYTSARYQFMSGSSSGYQSKAAFVDRLPAGAKTVCYVNPQDPTDAVIIRGFTADIWFGLIPLVFAAVGLFGLAGMAFGKGKLRPRLVSLPDGTPAATWLTVPGQTASGDLVAASTRGGKFAWLMIFALIWNGLVSVFVVSLLSDWRHGDRAWGMALFLTIFVVAGVFLAGMAFREALAMFNPKLRLRANAAAVPLGGALQVTWTVDGRVERLNNLRILLEGREEATYRRGTDTRTDRHVFKSITLVATTDQAKMRTGTEQITIPGDTMHSFASSHNRIIWTLRAQGEIAKWPDIDDAFAFAVLPKGMP